MAAIRRAPILMTVTTLAGLVPGAGGVVAQTGQNIEQPLEVLAVRVREQGHVCNKPISAQRNAQASRPLEAAWVLQCDNASYRIVLHPDMAARIERIN